MLVSNLIRSGQIEEFPIPTSGASLRFIKAD
jgi:hypothetical protein